MMIVLKLISVNYPTRTGIRSVAIIDQIYTPTSKR